MRRFDEATIGFTLWWNDYFKAHVIDVTRADDMITHMLKGINFTYNIIFIAFKMNDGNHDIIFVL